MPKTVRFILVLLEYYKYRGRTAAGLYHPSLPGARRARTAQFTRTGRASKLTKWTGGEELGIEAWADAAANAVRLAAPSPNSRPNAHAFHRNSERFIRGPYRRRFYLMAYATKWPESGLALTSRLVGGVISVAALPRG